MKPDFDKQGAGANFKHRKSVADLKSEFIQMLLENQALVHKVCRAFCPDKQDRQDLFQEIALQLWRAYPGFRGDSKESTWMYRVSLNVAIAFGRRKRPAAVELSERQFQLPVPENPDNSDQLAALYQAVYTLSDVEKAIILLYFEEKSMEEIAALTGVSVGNVRVKMHRIREKLRTLMMKS